VRLFGPFFEVVRINTWRICTTGFVRRMRTTHWQSVSWALGAWSAYGFISAALSHFMASTYAKPLTWPHAIIAECGYAYIAAFLSPAVIRLADRFRIEPPNWFRNVSLHAVASVAFSVITYLIWQVAMYLTGIRDWERSLTAELQKLAWGLSDGGPLYWVVVFVHNAGYYYKRYEMSAAKAADLNAQLAQAQLQSLKMQLHPHFLFNALHSISELIHADPASAERMVIALSHLLRRSLANSSALEVPLECEVEMTRVYLDIEKMRFDDRLLVDVQVADDAQGAMVPNLILQPLVENAIKHGISHRPGKGCIAVEAVRKGGVLVITIRDNGAGFNTDKRPIVEGVGLSTTRARLEKLYGAGQSFHFVRRPGGTEAVIRLPFRVATTGEGAYEHVARTNS
jgi:two-component system LytT family sensor kinase